MGFDLEKNAFVKPHGNGETTDFELEFQSDGKKYLEHTGSRLKVRFVRSFDGFYIAKRDTYSTFWSAYHADTNSIFKQELSLFTQKKANGKWQRNELEEDAYLVVRTRSTVDKKGNLKSAHYSKIGRLKFSIGETTPGCVLLFYYYNPIANDANLELDYSKRIRPLK